MKMSCFSYPIWYLFENYLQMFVSMILEIKSVSKWNLNKSVENGLMATGILLNLAYLIVWIVLLSVVIIKFFKILESNSSLNCLKVGLN